jgi:hypothetical protein
MGSFLRTNVTDEGFIRGAARVLVADPATTTFPTKISDIITLASGGSQYDALASGGGASGWSDIGATKGGVQITRNNTEEEFDVDQILTALNTLPTAWEMTVQTALAEVTLDHLAIAWEQPGVTTNTTVTPNEKTLNLGAPTAYTRRALAVLFQRPNGKIRAYVFRRVQRSPQESSLAFNKTGEQQSIPVTFRVLADTSVSDPLAQFGVIFDQQ